MNSPARPHVHRLPPQGFDVWELDGRQSLEHGTLALRQPSRRLDRNGRQPAP